MLAKVKGVTFRGLEVLEITIEVSVTRGLPAFEIVGLPNKAIEESRHRIKSAFVNSGLKFPDHRITVNLAPADISKFGSSYDFGIAVGIYCATQRNGVTPEGYFFGELSLDGAVKITRGAYLALEYASKQAQPIFISEELHSELADFSSRTIYPVRSLMLFLHNIDRLQPFRNLHVKPPSKVNAASYVSDIIGQEAAKRALVIAAAGNHNLLMTGSPGTGKSTMARSIIALLPPLSNKEAIEVKRIKSFSGENIDHSVTRPFRAPHHTISYSGLIGGGKELTPGEITRAHHGVLFMDEFCEFSRNVLEALRQPLQEHYITITRNNLTIRLPSRFFLVAAANPCPCGYSGHSMRKCLCSELQINNYAKKLSGPLADRIDLFVNLSPEADFTQKIGRKSNVVLDYSSIRNNIQTVRNIQNARLTNNVISDMEAKAKGLLDAAYVRLSLSPRGYIKVAKVARTIADLSGSEFVKEDHVAEAIQYRQRI
jgi:magnesium chelatase family protein